MRLNWTPIIDRAAVIVRSYDSGVTLRQLFYRLLSESLIPNTESAYKTLSRKTAEARRQGAFPDLVDHTRSVHRRLALESPATAIRLMTSQYRRDRQESQETRVYLGAEKATMLSLLSAWFDDLSTPVVLLRGYSSQTYIDDISSEVRSLSEPAVLVYAGDLDASGMDIERDFCERSGFCFEEVVRVAVEAPQIDEYRLTKQPGKKTDSRAAGFIEQYGSLFQVEIEAIEPDVLRQLYAEKIFEYLDEDKINSSIEQEHEDIQQLKKIIEESER